MKRILGLLLVFNLLMSSVAFGAEYVSPLSKKEFVEGETIEVPFTLAQTLDSVYAKVNGQTILYTSANGSPAVFSAYNLDERRLIFSGLLPDATAPWTHFVDNVGDVYIGAEGNLYKYTLSTNSLKKLGTGPGSKATYNICQDEDGMIYFGTYPNGKIIKYDPDTNSFIDFCTPMEGHVYVRSLTYHNGYLYAGTYYKNTCNFVRVNVKDPKDKQEFPLPQEFIGTDIYSWLSNMIVVRDKIFIMTGTQSNASLLLVFDTISQKFTDQAIKDYRGLVVSPEINGKVYYCGKNNIMEYDLDTDRVVDTGTARPENMYGFRGGSLIKLEDDKENFPGESIITINFSNGKPVVFNPQTKKIKTLFDVEVAGTAAKINFMAKGKPGEIIMSCFMGVKAAIYNVNSRVFEYFYAGQAESIVYYNGKAYLGNYPNAYIQEYEPKVSSKDNINIFKTTGEKQDRPLGMVVADDMLIWGTMAKYGTLEGALAIHHFDTGEYELYKNIVENQTITSVAYKDGIIYGTSGIWGGLGSTPTAETAKIFVWDVAKKEKIAEFYPEIPGIKGQILFMGDIYVGPDDLLWVGTTNMIFAMERKTFKVVKQIEFSPTEKAYNRAAQGGTKVLLEWGKDGLLYTNAGGVGIVVVDTNTMQYKRLLDETQNRKVPLFILDDDGNILYNDIAEGGILKKITVIGDESGITKEQMFNTSKKFENSTVLVNGADKMYVSNIGRKIPDKPVEKDGELFVSASSLKSIFNIKVIQNSLTKKATLLGKNRIIQFTLEGDSLIHNGEKIPVVQSDEMLLPIGYICRLLGREVTVGEGLLAISNEKIAIDESELKAAYLYFRYFAK